MDKGCDRPMALILVRLVVCCQEVINSAEHYRRASFLDSSKVATQR